MYCICSSHHSAILLVYLYDLPICLRGSIHNEQRTDASGSRSSCCATNAYSWLRQATHALAFSARNYPRPRYKTTQDGVCERTTQQRQQARTTCWFAIRASNTSNSNKDAPFGPNVSTDLLQLVLVSGLWLRPGTVVAIQTSKQLLVFGLIPLRHCFPRDTPGAQFPTAVYPRSFVGNNSERLLQYCCLDPGNVAYIVHPGLSK